MNQWDQFLTPYKQAVDELKVKLKGLRKQYEVVNTRHLSSLLQEELNLYQVLSIRQIKRYSVRPLT